MAEIPVHRSFGDIYRLAGISPNLDLLTNRWKVVSGMLSTLTMTQWLDLVRFVLELRPASDAIVKDVRDRCLAADPSFPTTGAELELKAIAATAILQAIDSNATNSDTLSLAIVSGECKGHRKIAPFTLLLEHAAVALANSAVTVRNRARLGLATIRAERKALDDLKKVTVEATAIRDAAAAAVEELATTTSTFQEAVADLAEKIDDAVDVLAEESDILWWVLSERSNDLKEPLAELSSSTAALVVAKELADLSIFVPGPAAAGAFLARQLRCAQSGSGTVTLSGAVSSLNTPWRSSLLAAYSNAGGDLCPVMQAIIKSIEATTATEWHPSFHKTTGLSADIAFEPLKLSQQLFDELMFIRSAAEQ